LSVKNCYWLKSTEVAWSVRLLVTFVSPEKRLNWSRCRYDGWLGWAQEFLLDVVEIPPMGMGRFYGLSGP